MKKKYLKNYEELFNNTKETIHIFAKCTCGKTEYALMDLPPQYGFHGSVKIESNCCKENL